MIIDCSTNSSIKERLHGSDGNDGLLREGTLSNVAGIVNILAVFGAICSLVNDRWVIFEFIGSLVVRSGLFPYPYLYSSRVLSIRVVNGQPDKMRMDTFELNKTLLILKGFI